MVFIMVQTFALEHFAQEELGHVIKTAKINKRNRINCLL